VKSFFLLLGCLAPFSVHAQVWDANFDFSARTYPFGAAIGVEGGYGVPIWGDTAEYKYGYTRVGGRLQSSGVVNTLTGQVEVFPISFWGLQLKSGWGHRQLDDISTLDCTRLECSGSLSRTSLGSPLFWAAGPFFGRVRLEYTWVASSENTYPLLADESTNLRLRGSGDEIRRWDVLAGLKIREDLKAMLFYETNKAQKTESRNETYGAIVRHSWDSHTVYFGTGIYESTTTSPHLQFFGSYVLTFAQGLGY